MRGSRAARLGRDRAHANYFNGRLVTAYEASPVKRQRSTNAQLDVIDQAIIQAVEDDHPVSLRGVFYRVVSAGAIEKTEEGYDLIGRQLLKLRRAGAVPYSSITDGTLHPAAPHQQRHRRDVDGRRGILPTRALA